MNEQTTLSNRTKGIITLIIVALYLILTTDAVTDAMIGLGQLDDLIVFALGVANVVGRLRKPQE